MKSSDEATARLRENVLEAQVRAALAGHDIGPFDPVNSTAGGYQAECRKCFQTIWLRDDGLMYSLLAERCPGH